MRVAIVSLVLAAIQPCLSWSEFGHRTTAYLAEKHLTPQARELFDHLLEDEVWGDYSDAATWADKDGRKYFKWADYYHYINPVAEHPPASCGVDYPSDCPRRGCIIRAIANYTGIVMNSSAKYMLRKNATMFLMHFVGDLHQPLHVTGLAEGGTKIRPVCWKSDPVPGRDCPGDRSLHKVWDREIPHRIRGLSLSASNDQEKTAARKWADELYGRQLAAGLAAEAECADLTSDRCIVQWAVESNWLVCSNVVKRGVEWIQAHDLSEEYFDENWEVVEDRVALGGLRLGAWMNAIASALAGSSTHLRVQVS